MKKMFLTLLVFSSVSGFAGVNFYEIELDGSAAFLSIDSINNNCNTLVSVKVDEDKPEELKKITQDCSVSGEELILSNDLRISTCVNNEFRRDAKGPESDQPVVVTKYKITKNDSGVNLTNVEDIEDSNELITKTYVDYKKFVKENCTK